MSYKQIGNYDALRKQGGAQQTQLTIDAIHPGLEKVRGNPKVAAALAFYKKVYAEWMSKGTAEGRKPYDTPLHQAENELNAAVETALHG